MAFVNRRGFLVAAAGAVPGLASITRPAGAAPIRAAGKAVIVGSGNALRPANKAMELMNAGSDPLDAIVAGINIVEDDPEDMSVGYGGLPNEDGVVQLDASVMHGPSHKAGAVAALENIKNPSSVALRVLRKTDHVILVGAGALKFARAMGFPEQNLLTDKARQAWLKWKSQQNKDDDWLDEDQQIQPIEGARHQSKVNEPLTPAPKREGAGGSHLEWHAGIPYTAGTIHCSAVDASGNMAGCTSTSGLSYKLAGRVGDSPIVGAGMFVDNEVGAAGATGRGEAVIQSCGAFQVVRHMADGLSPADACLKLLKWIADHTKQKYLLDGKGRPNFGVTVYALRKDGAYGCATMRAQKDRANSESFVIHDGTTARTETCAALFED